MGSIRILGRAVEPGPKSQCLEQIQRLLLLIPRQQARRPQFYLLMVRHRLIKMDKRVTSFAIATIATQKILVTSGG